ncbi:MAG TPA: phage antirepressor KilAC domain-containing protein [Paraburkholderia sp.]
MNMIPSNSSATMSTREIADLVEARHNDVVATVERLFSKGLLRSSRKTRHEATGGRPIEVYDLIERDCYLVVAGYSDEVRARVVDRWQALEAQVATAASQVPQTFSQALRLAAEQAEQIETQAKLIERQRPAVEFAHAVRDTKDAISIGDMARLLKIGQNRLFRQLRDDQFLMDDNRPYQKYIDRGYFRVIENVWIDAAKEPHPTFKTLVTGRGQVYLQSKYGVAGEVA